MAALARHIVFAALAALLAGTPALGQSRAGSEAAESRQMSQMIDGLLAQLHLADDEASAKAIEQAVWQAWLQSGSPTVDLLVQQAEKAMAENQHRIAISILSAAIELEPDYPEIWNRRATAYYLNRQYKRSLADA